MGKLGDWVIMLLRPLLALCLLLHVAVAWSQPAWRPDKAVEIIVPTGASGINDANARLMQKSFQEGKLGAKEIALVLSKCFENNTSIEKQLETAFYSLQKSATEKMNKMGEEVKSVSVSDMVVYEPKKRGKYERKDDSNLRWNPCGHTK